MSDTAFHRALYDRVTDEMLLTPVADLEEWEVDLLEAVFRGPYGMVLMERLDRFSDE